MVPERMTAPADQVGFTQRPSNSNTIDLTAWQAVRADAGAIAQPDQLNLPDESWFAASAPGTVAGALRSAGEWDWAAPPALDDHDWWYRCRFRCEDADAGGSLEFGGLASLADVWLNGTHILSSDNMFVAHIVDTGNALRLDNELVIRFRSLTASLSVKRARPRWRTRLVTHQSLRWIRTTLLGRMPGWSSAAQPVGPWRSVTLHPHNSPRLISRKVRARMDGADGVVSIAVRLRVPASAEIASASVAIGNVERAAIVRGAGGDFIVHGTIRIADANLWWPHTHGPQPLYDALIRVTVAGGTSLQFPIGRVAFRTIRLDTDGGGFGLRVNHESVFLRGACWSPPDPLQLHCSRSEYRRSLELARDAGMNMLRVSGTMVYEHDDFYDICDELGIMVWQDFMFANMDYPWADAEFIASVESEASQFLQRVGGHASLALLCGNSEVEQQAAMLGLPASEWRSPLFSEKLADLSAEHAASVPYWPSSPSGGVLPFHVNQGDGHYFGYGPYLRPASDVRASEVRFASETLAFSNVPEPSFVDTMPCGSAGAGHHADWKRGVPRDNGAGWDFEDVRDHYVRDIFGVDPMMTRYADPERYLSLGRAAVGEVMTHTIAEWRRSGSPCNGALVWMYHDLRPGAGWGILDYDGAPKSAYYYLARAFRPVTVVMSDEGLNGIAMHVVNDGPNAISPQLRLSLFRGAVQVGGVVMPITVLPRSTQLLSADELLGAFTDISYAYRFGRPNHDTIVATLVDKDDGAVLAESFHFPLGVGAPRPATQLETRVERLDSTSYSLSLHADELAVAVSIEANGWRISDNYFHIAPGGERTVILTASGPRRSLSGRVTALNTLAPRSFHAE
jgi:beta-mannosidase